MLISTLATARGRLRRWAGRPARALPALVLKDIGLARADLVRDCTARSLGW
jgi:hypothetical protein